MSPGSTTTHRIAAAVLVIVLTRPASPEDSEPAILGISGNGGLTVAVDRQGRVAACLWPRPSFHDQLTYAPSENSSAIHGIVWGLRRNGQTVWLESPWVPVETDDQSGGIRLTPDRAESSFNADIEQHTFVHPDRNLLAMGLRVSEAPDHDIVFAANMTPTTRKLPEMPIADSLLDHLNDFAAFRDSENNATVHFRPANPGAADWERAEQLASADSPVSSWTDFAEGTWIAIGGDRPYLTSSWLPEPAEAMAVDEALDSPAARAWGASGQVTTVYKLQSANRGEGGEATLFLAFGATYKDAVANLAFARAKGFDALAADRLRANNAWLNRAAFPDIEDTKLQRLLQRAWLTLGTNIDAQSGAIIRSPTVFPHLARDFPSDSAWATYVLDRYGLHDAAERHVQFLLKAVRTEFARGKPPGSVPHALYTDGVEASPHINLDLEATAWLAWSVNAHAEFLPVSERIAWLDKSWDRITLMGDFLAIWEDPRSAAPAGVADPVTLSDIQSQRQTVAAHMGLSSVLEAAAALQFEPPGLWVERFDRLTLLLIRAIRSEAWDWRAGAPIPFHDLSLVVKAGYDVDEVIRARLTGFGAEPASPSDLRTLAELELLRLNGENLRTSGAVSDVFYNFVESSSEIGRVAHDTTFCAWLLLAGQTESAIEAKPL